MNKSFHISKFDQIFQLVPSLIKSLNDFQVWSNLSISCNFDQIFQWFPSLIKSFNDFQVWSNLTMIDVNVPIPIVEYIQLGISISRKNRLNGCFGFGHSTILRIYRWRKRVKTTPNLFLEINHHMNQRWQDVDYLGNNLQKASDKSVVEGPIVISSN